LLRKTSGIRFLKNIVNKKILIVNGSSETTEIYFYQNNIWFFHFHEIGLIQPSSSDFATAIIMLAKKDLVGLWTNKRMCGDYRPLNLVTP